MKRSNATLALLGAALPGVASAQAFELNRFRPAPLPSDGFSAHGADVPGHLGFSLSITADYAHEPLIVELATREEYAVVDHQLALHLGAALGLGERGLLYGIVPVNAVVRGDDPPAGIVTRLPRPERGGMGDARIGARVRLLGDARSKVALAGQLALVAPLASVNGRQLYAGDDMLQVEPALLLDVHLGKTTLRFNVGARVREDEALLNSWVGDELSFAVGAQYAFSPRWRVVADLYGASAFQHFGRGLETPLEALLGGKYQHPAGFHAALAVGPGLVHGLGTPEVRALATVGFARRNDPAAPREAAASQPVPLDTDGDAVLDSEDACFDVPEDRDGDRDADGCPEDPAPAATSEREPPPSSPSDSDFDGVPDADDACPSERGAAEAQGCPEAPLQRSAQTLRILGRVHFASGDARAEPGSLLILRAVKKTLTDDPAIRVLRVEGHTDAHGDPTFNLNLSKRRARTIVRWLRENGVEMDRVEVVACGESQPADREPDASGRRDRRVELKADPAPLESCVPAL